MSKARDEVQVIPPKGDGSGGKITPVGGASKDLCGVTLLRAEATQAPKEDWQTQEETQRLLHQMKRPMLHPKKKPRTRKVEREIRDPTTLLPLIMMIYLTLASSSSYPVFTPKPSTHRMHDPGSIVPHIQPKGFTDNQMSQIKYDYYYINSVSKDYDDSWWNGTTEDSKTP
jgi:hypothetical protein